MTSGYCHRFKGEYDKQFQMVIESYHYSCATKVHYIRNIFNNNNIIK